MPLIDIEEVDLQILQSKEKLDGFSFFYPI